MEFIQERIKKWVGYITQWQITYLAKLRSCNPIPRTPSQNYTKLLIKLLILCTWKFCQTMEREAIH